MKLALNTATPPRPGGRRVWRGCCDSFRAGWCSGRVSDPARSQPGLAVAVMAVAVTVVPVVLMSVIAKPRVATPVERG